MTCAKLVWSWETYKIIEGDNVGRTEISPNQLQKSHDKSLLKSASDIPSESFAKSPKVHRVVRCEEWLLHKQILLCFNT